MLPGLQAQTLWLSPGLSHSLQREQGILGSLRHLDRRGWEKVEFGLAQAALGKFSEVEPCGHLEL